MGRNALKKAPDKLAEHLGEASVFGVAGCKLADKNKKIAAAAYRYKADHRYANDDDEWGEIRFDFSSGTAQVIKPTDGDTSKTKVFAEAVIRQIGKLSVNELPKRRESFFELE